MGDLTKTLQTALRVVAPTIASSLVGPFSGMAIEYLGEKFLGEKTAALPDIVNKVQRAIEKAPADQDTRIFLAELEGGFKVRMKELDNELEEMGFRDLQNARNMAMRFQSLDAHISFTVAAFVMYALFNLGYFWLLRTGIEMTPDQIMLTGRSYGTVEGVLMSAVIFWFGKSSRGRRGENDG